MGYHTQTDLKNAIKEFQKQSFGVGEYDSEIDAYCETYASGLAAILWQFLYDSKVQSEIPVQVNTGSGTGNTIQKGDIIPPIE